MDSSAQGIGLLTFIIIMFMYFFPSVIAVCRSHNNALAIFLLNLFLGITGFGWIGALIWSATNSDRPNA